MQRIIDLETRIPYHLPHNNVHTLQWRNNGHDGVSNHQPSDCLFNRYSGTDERNIKAPCHWPSCGEVTGTGEFPEQGTSYAENVSVWWRHHDLGIELYLVLMIHLEFFKTQLMKMCPCFWLILLRCRQVRTEKKSTSITIHKCDKPHTSFRNIRWTSAIGRTSCFPFPNFHGSNSLGMDK